MKEKHRRTKKKKDETRNQTNMKQKITKVAKQKLVAVQTIFSYILILCCEMLFVR